MICFCRFVFMISIVISALNILAFSDRHGNSEAIRNYHPIPKTELAETHLRCIAWTVLQRRGVGAKSFTEDWEIVSVFVMASSWSSQLRWSLDDPLPKKTFPGVGRPMSAVMLILSAVAITRAWFWGWDNTIRRTRRGFLIRLDLNYCLVKSHVEYILYGTSEADLREQM